MEQSQHLRYEFIDKSDIEFIKALFGSEDVRKFYILREDHSKDLSLFVDYLVNAHRNQTSLNYKIMLLNGTPIGIIGGELQRDFNYNVAWNVSYAILPAYRNRGYAEEMEAFMCEWTISHGLISYGHVKVGNEKSMSLQRKIGVEFWDGTLSWLFKKD